jgi:rhodanese-related sulfurtransferase
MTQQSVRSFGFGLIAAAAALFLFDYTSKDQPLSNEEMIQLLEENNYTVLTADGLTEQPAETKPVETVPPAEKEQTVQEESFAESKGTTVTIEIESGMSSDDVVGVLKKAGVIEDEESFNTYLTEIKYASKLQIGTFTLSPNMSNEEIASTLIK